ncbi:MAG: PcfB family protein [Eubacteriales bacterium]|nr:PcfB family protein [Eubacteriales bacterium]
MKTLQEEIESRTVNLVVTTTKLCIRTVVSGINAYLRDEEKAKLEKGKTEIHGKQSVKELIGKNDGVSRMSVNDESIRAFEREARKFGVDFAVTKDKKARPPVYTIFFKAKDTDALQHIADSLVAKQLHARPSILKQLRKLREKARAIAPKVRQKDMEHSL